MHNDQVLPPRLVQARYRPIPMEGVQDDAEKTGGTLPGFLLIGCLP